MSEIFESSCWKDLLSQHFLYMLKIHFKSKYLFNSLCNIIQHRKELKHRSRFPEQAALGSSVKTIFYIYRV